MINLPLVDIPISPLESKYGNPKTECAKINLDKPEQWNGPGFFDQQYSYSGVPLFILQDFILGLI